MKQLYKIYNVAKADFLERIRRYSFLVILGLTVWASSIYLPPTDSLTGMHVNIGGYRGLYNSAWIGSSVVMCTIMFLSLFGFYLVKNSIERDMTTKVGQIIAATSVKNSLYFVGKLFSNFAVLASIIFVTAVSAAVLQLIRGEVMQIEIWTLFSPFILVALPAMFVVSAIALIFECIPFLKGTLGNILYFTCVWPVMGIIGITPLSSAISDSTLRLVDPLGLSIPLRSMAPVVKSVFPRYNGAFAASFATRHEPLKIFIWEGIVWDSEIILGRFLWITISIIVVTLSSLLFKRFDTNGKMSKKKKERKTKTAAEENLANKAPSEYLPFSKLTVAKMDFSFLAILKSEFLLTIKTCPKWHIITLCTLQLFCIFSPMETVKTFWFPALLILPIKLWSDLGSREKKYNTSQLIFSAPYSVKHQLTAQWVSGVIVTVLLLTGLGIRTLMAADILSMVSLLICALFVPTLALFLGILTGKSMVFEIIYITLWYIGPLNKLPVLDYTHFFTDSQNTNIQYLVLTVLMIVLSIIGRKRQITDI